MTSFYLSTDLGAVLLALAVIVPLLLGLVMLWLPASIRGRWVDLLGILGVFFPLLVALYLWGVFTPSISHSGYAFLSSTPLGLQGLGATLQLGLNGLSMPIFFLTAIVGCAAGVYTYSHPPQHKGLFWGLLLLILSGTLGAFASVDIFYAFLLHEVALLPTILALFIFGGPERRRAALEMGVFVILGSLVTLAGILYVYFMAGASSFSIIDIRSYLQGASVSAYYHVVAWGLLILGGALMAGLWPFYGWVPRLLTQAPMAVAMLHGGALKFFAAYFLLQFFVGLLHFGVLQVSVVVSILCAANILLLGWAALAQTDMRRLVAYTAAMHTGAFFLAITSYTYEAATGLLLLIVGSGLSTALLLMLSGVLEQRLGSSQMSHIGGLRVAHPRLATLLMIGFMSLAALPCFVTFWGELGILVGAVKGAPYAALAVFVSLVISALIALRSLSGLLMGPPRPSALQDLGPSHTLASWLLVVPLIAFAIVPGVITSPINHLLPTLLFIKL